MTDVRRLSLLPAAAMAALIATACGDVPTAGRHADAAPSLTVQNAILSNQPVRLKFEKCIVDPDNGIWEGRVSGDFDGRLRAELREQRVAGGGYYLQIDMIIGEATESFVADLRGFLNLTTGRVVLNGRVVQDQGFGFIDTQVHEEGQLVDSENSCFVGNIRIMPATAG